MPDDAEDENRPLAPEEAAIWRDFLAWSQATTGQVEQALVAATGMSAAEFGILVRLEEAGGTLPQRELQHALLWTATRLSHQLTRSEHRGLIARSSSGHGRTVDLHLTPAGLEALEASRGPHGAAVRRHFLSHLPLQFPREH